MGGGGARFGGGGARFGGRGGGGGGWGGGGGHHHGGHRGRFRGGFGPGAWRGYWGPYWNRNYLYEETPTYFVRSRIGGQVWADDIGYTWADAVRVAAAKAASTPPRSPGDYIEVMLANGTNACSFTAAGGRWVSSCGDFALGASTADSPPSAGTWLAVGAVAVGLWMYFGSRPISQSDYRS